MRKPSESGDDIAMPHRIVEKVGIGKIGKQTDRIVLIVNLFRMFERKVEEWPLPAVDQPVCPLRNGQPRLAPRQRVGGEGERRGAIHVAGQLIKNDDGGEP